MLLIGAGLLALAVTVQRRLVDTGWDPAPGRERPGSGEATPVVTGRSYPKIPVPAGAPAPPPPPA
jgi:PTS system ascorbate-specific IIC component